jgi:hypothetical protein
LKQKKLQTAGFYPDFLLPCAVETDLIFAVARPPLVTLMVALADELGCPTFVSMTTEAFPTAEASASDLDDP